MTVDESPSQCLSCARLRSPLDGFPPRVCGAFMEGIPAVIWENKADHRNPFAGDQGLRWGPVDDYAEFPEWAFIDFGEEPE